MPKASDKQKEKQTVEVMTLETIAKMIKDQMDETKELRKEMKSMNDSMNVRDEKLAQAEGEIVHLCGKTRDLEKDYSSMDRRIQDQETAIANQAVTIETQNLKMQELEKKIEMSGGGCDKLYRLLGDIDRRQQQLERQISPADLQKSSCYLFLHNLAMPDGVTLRDLLDHQATQS